MNQTVAYLIDCDLWCVRCRKESYVDEDSCIAPLTGEELAAEITRQQAAWDDPIYNTCSECGAQILPKDAAIFQ